MFLIVPLIYVSQFQSPRSINNLDFTGFFNRFKIKPDGPRRRTVDWYDYAWKARVLPLTFDLVTSENVIVIFPNYTKVVSLR